MSGEQPAELAARVAALEARVEALERGGEAPGRDAGGGASSLRERFWVLEGLKQRLREGEGAVQFAGVVPVAGDRWLEWQWGATSRALLGADWAELAPALAALGHPVRLLLLREVLSGTSAAAELAGREGLGTSGQLYHHLRQLVHAGWLRTTARGRYEVPPERVVPLLVVLTAAGPQEP